MNHFKTRSSIRLPFTPRNEALELKKEIREALSQLNAEEHKILYAYFAACRREFFDVENVLFYNICQHQSRNSQNNRLKFTH